MFDENEKECRGEADIDVSALQGIGLKLNEEGGFVVLRLYADGEKNGKFQQDFLISVSSLSSFKQIVNDRIDEFLEQVNGQARVLH